ncbi:hypothetical protein PI124_g16766 [Phytophthora idaei]|nr:hypothetical protein PI126_g5990 [Phytophthora idaei]KAG3238272.1 hypothetical protein PI124_g16766 [Phytophthora idaei]
MVDYVTNMDEVYEMCSLLKLFKVYSLFNLQVVCNLLKLYEVWKSPKVCKVYSLRN